MNLMEADYLLKALIQFGSTGIMAWVMYKIAQRFMDETVKQMSSRIDALEKESSKCQEDRKELHKEFNEFLKDFLRQQAAVSRHPVQPVAVATVPFNPPTQQLHP